MVSLNMQSNYRAEGQYSVKHETWFLRWSTAYLPPFFLLASCVHTTHVIDSSIFVMFIDKHSWTATSNASGIGDQRTRRCNTLCSFARSNKSNVTEKQKHRVSPHRATKCQQDDIEQQSPPKVLSVHEKCGVVLNLERVQIFFVSPAAILRGAYTKWRRLFTSIEKHKWNVTSVTASSSC